MTWKPFEKTIRQGRDLSIGVSLVTGDDDDDDVQIKQHSNVHIT
jgi:hypothetical protein